jgi:hypothetical protein
MLHLEERILSAIKMLKIQTVFFCLLLSINYHLYNSNGPSGIWDTQGSADDADDGHHHHHHLLYAGYLYLYSWDKLSP